MSNTEIAPLSGIKVGGTVASAGQRVAVVMPWGNILQGDCLEVITDLPKGSMDLIYLDPPFFTGRDHEGNKEKRGEGVGFSDRWREGIHTYIAWLRVRVEAMRQLLKPGGVFLLHLDWHAVHYAKVMCDEVFEGGGGGGFQNELIWYYQTGGASKGRFSRKHDTILFYSMGREFYFDGKAVAIPRGAGAMKRAQCATGARIKATDTHKNPDDVLVVPALNPMALERNGYPTQKPVALLEILIKALCPPGGSVGDFCCGSGTTLEAAEKLGRRWVGADANPAAVKLARERLEAKRR